MAIFYVVKVPFCATVKYLVYKVVLTFESVDQILNCDHSFKTNEIYFLCTVYYAIQGGSNFSACG